MVRVIDELGVVFEERSAPVCDVILLFGGVGFGGLGGSAEEGEERFFEVVPETDVEGVGEEVWVDVIDEV